MHKVLRLRVTIQTGVPQVEKPGQHIQLIEK
jgi:hypothetical protein